MVCGYVWISPVVDVIFAVAEMFVSDIVCDRYMDVILLHVMHFIFLHFFIFNFPDIY